LTNTGSLMGTGTVQADVSNAGTVAPGFSPGILAVNGNYTQTSAGTLAIELAGTTPGSGYDRLAVSGTATLDGTLSVQAIQGFSPASDATFQVLTPASRSGQFATTPSDYLVAYGASSVTVSPTAAPAPGPQPQPAPAPAPAPQPAPAPVPAPAAQQSVNLAP